MSVRLRLAAQGEVHLSRAKSKELLSSALMTSEQGGRYKIVIDYQEKHPDGTGLAEIPASLYICAVDVKITNGQPMKMVYNFPIGRDVYTPEEIVKELLQQADQNEELGGDKGERQRLRNIANQIKNNDLGEDLPWTIDEEDLPHEAP